MPIRPGARDVGGTAVAFRTSAGEDRGLGQEIVTSSHSKADTYMQALLRDAAKEQDVWHRRGRPQG
jgi:hypothetical protein